MTNAEKWLKDGVSEYDFTEFVFNNGNIYCEAGKEDECYIEKLDLLHLLQQPVRPTLTEDERVILRSMNKNASIWREKGKLWIHCEGNLFNEDTFQFVKERRRIRNKGVVER